MSDRDENVKRRIKLRLSKASETVRAQEIRAVRNVTPGKQAPDAPPTDPKSKNLTLNLKRKGVTVGSKAELALREDDEETQKKWKARAFFGRHLTVLQCNNCAMSRVCPKFKAGYECAFLPYLNSHKIETANDLVRYMKQHVENSMRRAQLMSMSEAASGGMPSVETSEALDMAFRQLKDLHSVVTEKVDEEIAMEGEGTIVGQIFGGMKAKLLLEETIQMKKDDPLANLPKVDDTELSPALTLEANVSAELVRDAIVSSGSSKKDLKSLPDVSITSGEISKP